ncbi:MAG: hypothetical protein J6G98_04725 [Bacilli bacterium]|nr:hypothetical protein [Bacilli bacterium]
MYTKYATFNGFVIALDDDNNVKAFDNSENIDEMLDLENRLDVLAIKSDYLDYCFRTLEDKYKEKKFFKQKLSKLLSNVNILFLIVMTFNIISNSSLLISSLVFLTCSEVLVFSMIEFLAILTKKEYLIESNIFKDQIEMNNEEISNTQKRLMEIKNNTKKYDLKCNDVNEVEYLKKLKNTYVSTYGLVDTLKVKKLK